MRHPGVISQLVSRASEGDFGDFWRTVEAEGHSDGAESAIDVELDVRS